MASGKHRSSREAIANRGDALYETEVRPRLSPEDDGMLVAIDVDSGAFVVDADELEALQRLRRRCPDAQIWLKRVGSRHVHRFGGQEVQSCRWFVRRARPARSALHFAPSITPQ